MQRGDVHERDEASRKHRQRYARRFPVTGALVPMKAMFEAER